jgi:hypothetical protein
MTIRSLPALLRRLKTSRRPSAEMLGCDSLSAVLVPAGSVSRVPVAVLTSAMSVSVPGAGARTSVTAKMSACAGAGTAAALAARVARTVVGRMRARAAMC